jgi:hypothetical protein
MGRARVLSSLVIRYVGRKSEARETSKTDQGVGSVEQGQVILTSCSRAE